ncbi:hypothetical protein E1267_12030 [Nonomuraea longispora]|uniref:Uncharacterized protein n=1 Tax=Nonomuraea longispora TaxID=1848320 RepID=A0A4R4NF41_9ACTN|nr:hypothetical protein E1267_12030 [Nonomuraea longispora]
MPEPGRTCWSRSAGARLRSCANPVRAGPRRVPRGAAGRPRVPAAARAVPSFAAHPTLTERGAGCLRTFTCNRDPTVTCLDKFFCRL